MVRAHEWNAHRRLSRAAGHPRPWWASPCAVPEQPLHLDRYSAGDRAVVVVRGELDATSASRLESYATATPLAGRAVLELDLSGVHGTGTAGLSALVAIRRWCDQRGLALTLRAVQPSVWRVIQVTGTESVFSAEPALAAGPTAVPPSCGEDLVLF